MFFRTLFILSLATLALALSGCISSESTKYTDIDRVKVSFASEKAGRLFYETLSRIPASEHQQESKSSVNLILVAVEQRTVTGPNRLFNEAVALCDSDKDGVISETEAEIFASSSHLLKRRA